MKTSTSLVAAGNTANPSLIVLRSKGYKLRIDQEEDGRLLYLAAKGGKTLLAYSAPELLGLAALWESLGEDWNRQSPDILGELTDTSAALSKSR